jgi:hypothetical protein
VQLAGPLAATCFIAIVPPAARNAVKKSPDLARLVVVARPSLSLGCPLAHRLSTHRQAGPRTEEIVTATQTDEGKPAKEGKHRSSHGCSDLGSCHSIIPSPLPQRCNISLQLSKLFPLSFPQSHPSPLYRCPLRPCIPSPTTNREFFLPFIYLCHPSVFITGLSVVLTSPRPRLSPTNRLFLSNAKAKAALGSSFPSNFPLAPYQRPPKEVGISADQTSLSSATRSTYDSDNDASKPKVPAALILAVFGLSIVSRGVRWPTLNSASALPPSTYLLAGPHPPPPRFHTGLGLPRCDSSLRLLVSPLPYITNRRQLCNATTSPRPIAHRESQFNLSVAARSRPGT